MATTTRPAQPMPTQIRVLQEHEFDLLTDTVKIESEATKTRVIKLPIKVHKLAASSEKNSDDTKDDTTQKRAQIGFVKRDDTNTSDDTTKIVGGGYRRK